jgi:hemerythrin-like domain-containing protein
MPFGSADPYDQVLETMAFFHSLLRHKWADINKDLSSSNPNAKRLISAITDFCTHLDMHHRIEEMSLFPILAKRLPQFKRTGAHVAEHAMMHKALEDLQGYAANVQSKQELFNKVKAQGLAKALEDALFPHLQEEEESLKGENLRKAGFTLAEVSKLRG